MTLKKFSELYKIDYNFTNMLAINQYWQVRQKYDRLKMRPTNALLLFIGCDGCYKSETETIYVPCGNMFFISANSKYTWTFSNHRADSISTILFEFLLVDNDGNPITIEDSSIINISDFYLYNELFSLLVSEFSKPQLSMSKLKSTAYSLTSTIADEIQKNYILSDKFLPIYPGIKYLENDSLQELTIEEIAKKCCVSVNYFERLFKEYTGITPTKYRLQKKIGRAQRMLKNGRFNLQQIATETGFSDYAYFCRVFKKMCGCTPTEYKNR